MPSITTLEFDATLGYWEVAEYIAVGLVILGVVGEYIADFTKWGKASEWRKDRIGKFSTLLLITALAAELVCLVRTNQLSGQVIAQLKEDTSKANKEAKEAASKVASAYAQAAEAHKIAEQERLERVKLELEVNAAKSMASKVAQKQAPREISEAQRSQIIIYLALAPKGKIEFRCVASDNEAIAYTALLKTILANAGYEIVEPTVGFMTAGGVSQGLTIKIAKQFSPPAEGGFIQKAFESAGISMAGAVEDSAFPLGDDVVRIYVNHKD